MKKCCTVDLESSSAHKTDLNKKLSTRGGGGAGGYSTSEKLMRASGFESYWDSKALDFIRSRTVSTGVLQQQSAPKDENERDIS